MAMLVKIGQAVLVTIGLVGAVHGGNVDSEELGRIGLSNVETVGFQSVPSYIYEVDLSLDFDNAVVTSADIHKNRACFAISRFGGHRDFACYLRVNNTWFSEPTVMVNDGSLPELGEEVLLGDNFVALSSKNTQTSECGVYFATFDDSYQYRMLQTPVKGACNGMDRFTLATRRDGKPDLSQVVYLSGHKGTSGNKYVLVANLDTQGNTFGFLGPIDRIVVSSTLTHNRMKMNSKGDMLYAVSYFTENPVRVEFYGYRDRTRKFTHVSTFSRDDSIFVTDAQTAFCMNDEFVVIFAGSNRVNVFKIEADGSYSFFRDFYVHNGQYSCLLSEENLIIIKGYETTHHTEIRRLASQLDTKYGFLPYGSGYLDVEAIALSDRGLLVRKVNTNTYEVWNIKFPDIWQGKYESWYTASAPKEEEEEDNGAGKRRRRRRKRRL